MEKTFEKLDSTTIAVTQTIPVVTHYKLRYLREQRKTIVAQRKRDNEQRDAEIAEIDELIAQCKSMNIIDGEADETDTLQ